MADPELSKEIAEYCNAVAHKAVASAQQFLARPDVKAAIHTKDEIGHEAFLALVDQAQRDTFVSWQLDQQPLTPSLARSILRRSGWTNPALKATTNTGSPVRLRQSQTSRRSHRSNGPPSKEDDLSSLRPKARAVEVYRRLLGRGERIPVATMDAALIAAGIQPRNGTDMRVRHEIGVKTACVGKFQGHHEIWLTVELREPLQSRGVVTPPRLGETEEEHSERHRRRVQYALAVNAWRERVTGQVAA